MAQRVNDLALSLQWLESLLWCSFDPWPGNFHMLWVWPKKKKIKCQCNRTYIHFVVCSHEISLRRPFPPLNHKVLEVFSVGGLFVCLFVLLFRAAPIAYGVSQARGQIGATAAGLCHSHSNTRTELHHSSWQHWIPKSLSEARD